MLDQKNPIFFSYIVVLELCGPAKFEVHMFFHLRETKEEKYSCSMLVS